MAGKSWFTGVSSSICTCGRRRGGTRTAARSVTCSWPITCGTRRRSGRGCRSSTTSAGRSPPRREALERLVASVSRHLDPGRPGPRPRRSWSSPSPGRWAARWVLDALWERLGIGPAMRGLLTGRRLDASAERVLFALTANRALAPSSKLAAARWASEDVLIARPARHQRTTRATGRWTGCWRSGGAAGEGDLRRKVSDLLGLEVDLLFFDTTSTYFETEEADAPVARDERGNRGPGRRQDGGRGAAGRRGSGPGASPRTTATTCPRS